MSGKPIMDGVGQAVVPRAIADGLILTGAVAGAIGGAVATLIQGALEHRTPSWQEYRDNIEAGAIIGGIIGFLAPFTLPWGGEVAVGSLLLGTSAGTFVSGMLSGFAMGIVHRLNGEVPSQSKPPTGPCPAGFVCTPKTATPTTTPTPSARLLFPPNGHGNSGIFSRFVSLNQSDEIYVDSPVVSTIPPSSSTARRLEDFNQ